MPIFRSPVTDHSNPTHLIMKNPEPNFKFTILTFIFLELVPKNGVNASTVTAEYNIIKQWAIECPNKECSPTGIVSQTNMEATDFMRCVRLCTKVYFSSF